jgi:immunoglobulin I-set domain protein
MVPSVNVLGNFNGLDSARSGGYTPPDTQGAAGSDNYVETVNQTVAIYNKTGTNLAIDSLSDFWYKNGGLPMTDQGSFLSDPVVGWDEQIKRFIIGDQDVDIGTHFSNFDIAVSKTANPTTLTFADWNFFQVDTTENTSNGYTDDYNADYPGNLGWNHDALVFTLNMFPNSSSNGHVQINSININALADGTSLTPGVNAFQTDFGNNYSDFSLRPTVMHDSQAGDPMWFVEEGIENGNFTDNSIKVVKMSNDLSATPAFNTTNLQVNPYSQAVPERQPDGTAITTNTDSRIMKAAMANGLLVTAHQVSDAAHDQDEIQWYAIDTSSGTPTLQQQGDVSGGPGTYDAYPAIDINSQDDIGMSYIQSGTGAGQYMSMYVTGRIPSDAGGSMEAPVLVQAGQANYFPPAPADGGREGDLSGISVDSDGSFWVANEFTNTSTSYNWGTATAHFTVGNAAVAPSITSDPTNQVVAVGQSAIFSASANGTPTPTVQWQQSIDGGKTFSDINGETSTTLTLNNVTTAMSGYEYQAVFANSAGSVTSSAAILAVQSNSSPTTLTPGNATLTFNSAGLSMPISATVNSTSGTVNEGAVTFMVLNNGTAIGSGQAAVVNGQASTTLSLPSLSAGTYTIAESYHDNQGNFSDSNGNGQLTVNPAPTTINVFNITITITSSSVEISVTITSANGIVNEGNLTSTLNVLGKPVASVEAPVVDDTATFTLSLPKLFGSLTKTNSTVEVSPAGPSQEVFNIEENYQDSGGNFKNSSSNSSQLTVNPSSISTNLEPGSATVNFSPVGLLVPISATVASSSSVVNQGTVTFTVLDNGTAVLNNGAAVASTSVTVVNGQASEILELPSLPAGNYTISENYQDVNGGFSGSSNSGQLTVDAAPVAPVITVNPASQTVMAGSNVSFMAAAGGTPTPTVQWQTSTDGGQSWTNLAGATSTILSLPNVSTSVNGYEYRAVFSNSAGTAFTNAATLTVKVHVFPPPPPPPPALNVPPLLAFFDSLLGGVETVNANGTETITDYLFAFPLLVSTFDHSGNLVSVDLIGFDVTYLFG